MCRQFWKCKVVFIAWEYPVAWFRPGQARETSLQSRTSPEALGNSPPPVALAWQSLLTRWAETLETKVLVRLEVSVAVGKGVICLAFPGTQHALHGKMPAFLRWSQLSACTQALCWASRCLDTLVKAASVWAGPWVLSLAWAAVDEMWILSIPGRSRSSAVWLAWGPPSTS